MAVTDSEGELGHLLFVSPDSFRGVSTGARFAGGVSGHDVSAGHAVQWRLILVDAGIRGVIGSWSRGLGQILMESSLLLSARHGEDWGLGFARFLRGSQHWCQSVVVRSRCVISSPISVASSKAVGRVAEVSGGSNTLRAVSPGARHFKHGSVPLAAV